MHEHNVESIIWANWKLEIIGGRSEVKKLSAVSVVVLSLGILLAACGGGSKKTLLPEKTVQPKEMTSTIVAKPPVATATSSNVEQIIDVTGKSCSPAGTYKVTSKDLTEAIVNTVCDSAQHLTNDDETKLGGVIQFTSLQITSLSRDFEKRVDVSLRFRDCADCPRDFKTLAYFSQNILGDWQLDNSQLTTKETQSSIDAKVERDRNKQIQLDREIFSQIKVELIQQPEPLYFGGLRIPIRVVDYSVFKELNFLGQLENGSTMEFFCHGTLLNRVLATCQSTDSEAEKQDGQKVKILAYSFSIGSNSSGWIYFNQ